MKTKQRGPGYYPDSDILGGADAWDAATRDLVLRRVKEIPPIRFFTREELPVIADVFERLLPQADRPEELRIPVVHYVDERLYAGRNEGTIYEGMPEDPIAYRRGIALISEIARKQHHRPFQQLDAVTQERILLQLRHEHRQLWQLFLNDAIASYYAHPFAWDEIGFGGPAYPRGYLRLEAGRADPWEAEEKRHDWATPEETLSEETTEEFER